MSDQVEQPKSEVFGKNLRISRESAGLTIEQLANATRIMPNFIEALEAGDFDSLPGRVFGRGFLRSIIRIIGSGEELLAEYDACFDTKIQEAPMKEPYRAVETRPQWITRAKAGAETFYPGSLLKGMTRWGVVGALGVVVIVGALVGVIVQINSSSEETVREQITEVSKKAEIPPLPASEPKVNETNPEPLVAKVINPSGEPQSIVINVKKEVRIRLQIDNGEWQTMRLAPQEYKHSFKDSLNVLVFNAAAVDIDYNGKSLGNLGKEGRVRRLSFVKADPGKTAKM